MEFCTAMNIDLILCCSSSSKTHINYVLVWRNQRKVVKEIKAFPFEECINLNKLRM